MTEKGEQRDEEEEEEEGGKGEREPTQGCCDDAVGSMETVFSYILGSAAGWRTVRRPGNRTELNTQCPIKTQQCNTTM